MTTQLDCGISRKDDWLECWNSWHRIQMKSTLFAMIHCYWSTIVTILSLPMSWAVKSISLSILQYRASVCVARTKISLSALPKLTLSLCMTWTRDRLKITSNHLRICLQQKRRPRSLDFLLQVSIFSYQLKLWNSVCTVLMFTVFLNSLPNQN